METPASDVESGPIRGGGGGGLRQKCTMISSRLNRGHKHFGALHGLKDIDLDGDRGEVLVVLGPSGSGKSTLSAPSIELEPIDSGTIAIDGCGAYRRGHKLAQLRSDVGMVFQSFNLSRTRRFWITSRSRDERRQTVEGRGTRKAYVTAGAGLHRQTGRQVSGATVGASQPRVAHRAVVAMNPKVMRSTSRTAVDPR